MFRRLCSIRHASSVVVSQRVRDAQRSGRGVVALESTVITHGLAYPVNLATARALEAVVRDGGAEPATIAILDGRIHIGLEEEQLERIALAKDAIKVSTRDIAHALTRNVVGGTTVAATMWAADRAGIRVFSTGGIGGVHRGADQTFDVSADLIELSRTPVTVVCAGVKSILDIEKTIEYLETFGVNVVVYGKENVFPGFFTSRTPCKGQFNTTDLEEVANMICTSDSLGMNNGTILAVPIQKEFEAEGEVIEKAIERAIQEAGEKGIAGQATTPFLLKRIAQMTKEMSVDTNVALLKANAVVAARLSHLLVRDRRPSSFIFGIKETEQKNQPSTEKKPRVV